MLNEERIRLMTQMASFEEGEGKEYMPIKQYYRKDYVGYQMIRTFISSTISFGILFLLWVLYDLDKIAEQIADMDFMSLGISVIAVYLVFLVGYQIIACVIYNRKYSRATDRMKLYYSRLKKVQKLHEREAKLQPMEDWE